jgi:hypothetical protein
MLSLLVSADPSTAALLCCLVRKWVSTLCVAALPTDVAPSSHHLVNACHVCHSRQVSMWLNAFNEVAITAVATCLHKRNKPCTAFTSRSAASTAAPHKHVCTALTRRSCASAA